MPTPAPGKEKPPVGAKALALATLIAIVLVVVYVFLSFEQGRKDGYSTGYQIGPHYLGSSTWTGTPYALTPAQEDDVPCPSAFSALNKHKRGHLGHSDASAGGRRDTFTPYASPDDGPRGTTDPPALIYTPPITSNLRGAHPNWWRSDGGTHGLPPAAERPDFWAGDRTLHTYLARDPIPPLCEPAEVADGRRRPTCCGADSEWVDQWQYYGGPRGWGMSSFY
jgi:hypothetical protein